LSQKTSGPQLGEFRAQDIAVTGPLRAQPSGIIPPVKIAEIVSATGEGVNAHRSPNRIGAYGT
jgi:hypothetical protein